ncbi:Uncharacterised protein [Mycobacteroides abscessus subsp. abscessus]|nr:Uncharacterised protein [Mycobacteroides abscessus subsp. abscessus]
MLPRGNQIRKHFVGVLIAATIDHPFYLWNDRLQCADILFDKRY